MNYNEAILTEQYHTLKDFLFHYASFKFLHEKFEDITSYGSTEFWVYTINSHYYQAINLWCMIFGTEKNEIHWRKLGLNMEFTSIIISGLGIGIEDYQSYWKQLLDWRNQYSAHRVPGYRQETPDLKLARKVALLYEEWVATNIDASVSFSLELYEENFKDELQESFHKLLVR
ncbi:hypothetical protein M1K46_02375 [Fictibacillus sp. WQ 8-8]|uniref:hypothetical protein n=1 Tax=Fictibacillus sp. WQ 8-8 TaxID=2938788 RepID=UPI002109DA79|nr:hypothetical protein [Fictibacillus sp. WQ 8-8]MCQ6264512.1 hypothetical protein [Fictibacillus sp. WQ 8-8]